MENEVVCRRVRFDVFQQLLAGLKTCWIQKNFPILRVNDRILFQEVRGGLLTGRALEVLVTHVEINEYCPEGTCLISFQPSSSLAKIAIETYFGLFDMFSQLQSRCWELEKRNHELMQQKEVLSE